MRAADIPMPRWVPSLQWLMRELQRQWRLAVTAVAAPQPPVNPVWVDLRPPAGHSGAAQSGTALADRLDLRDVIAPQALRAASLTLTFDCELRLSASRSWQLRLAGSRRRAWQRWRAPTYRVELVVAGGDQGSVEVRFDGELLRRDTWPTAKSIVSAKATDTRR